MNSTFLNIYLFFKFDCNIYWMLNKLLYFLKIKNNRSNYVLHTVILHILCAQLTNLVSYRVYIITTITTIQISCSYVK